MTDPLSRIFRYSIFACVLAIAPAVAGAASQKINPPPSADLGYRIKAKERGIPLDGEAVVHWVAGPGSFSATNEARAMLIGKILESRSEGAIDAYGLAPVRFTEKRFRKPPTSTTFDRAANTIRFSASDLVYPIKGGEQDRTSVMWQLISIARASPAKFKPGTQWSFFVAGQRDADPWAFKVIRQEKIRTPLGELDTLHINRAPPPDSRDQRLDIWLAPSLEWYPVRLRFSDDNGDYIEQTLQTLTKKAS